MTFQTIRYETDARLASITLNRPERLNAIVPPMPEELETAIARANADPEVRVIVLQGAGTSFCAGFDLVDLPTPAPPATATTWPCPSPASPSARRSWSNSVLALVFERRPRRQDAIGEVLRRAGLGRRLIR
jgi:enoyl-CoA hydratase/carnithine racemase